jgi:hypothetical protein
MVILSPTIQLGRGAEVGTQTGHVRSLPGNVLHHHTVLNTFHPPGCVVEVGGDAQQQHKTTSAAPAVDDSGEPDFGTANSVRQFLHAARLALLGRFSKSLSYEVPCTRALLGMRNTRYRSEGLAGRFQSGVVATAENCYTYRR